MFVGGITPWLTPCVSSCPSTSPPCGDFRGPKGTASLYEGEDTPFAATEVEESASCWTAACCGILISQRYI